MSFEAAFLDSPFYRYPYPDSSLLSAATRQLETEKMKRDRRSTAANNKRAASKVAPRLYLTCLATAKDTTQLANLGITHVVSAIEAAPTFSSTYPLRTLHISVSDYDGEDILSHLPSTTSFIRGALAESPKNRVLVRPSSDCARLYTSACPFFFFTDFTRN